MDKKKLIEALNSNRVDVEYWYDDASKINSAINECDGIISVESVSSNDDAYSPVSYFDSTIRHRIIIDEDFMRGADTTAQGGLAAMAAELIDYDRMARELQNSLKNPSFRYHCRTCRTNTSWTVDDYAEKGTPVCVDCGEDMEMVRE